MGGQRQGPDRTLRNSPGFWKGSPSWQQVLMVSAGVPAVTPQAAKGTSAALASRRGKGCGRDVGGISKEVMVKPGSEG